MTGAAVEARPWLVLGASGSFGGGVARELLSRGIPVRALTREPRRILSRLPVDPNLEILEGDAGDRSSLRRATGPCGVVVHGINLPYQEWIPAMEILTRQVIEAAGEDGPRTILFPGNVYGLGRQTDRPVDETAENRSDSRKGSLRIRLEEMLRDAAATGSVRTIIMRAGDYFGPTVRNAGVDRIFGNAASGRPLGPLGNLDVDHQWAYLPDLARASVEVALLPDHQLSSFEVVHFPGVIARPQRGFLRSVAAAAGYPDLPIRRTPWLLLRVLGIFDPTIRELFELRYLWDESVILTSHRLPSLLPGYRDTPLDDAIRETLRSYRN